MQLLHIEITVNRNQLSSVSTTCCHVLPSGVLMIHLHLSVPGAKLPIRLQSCGSANQRELFAGVR